MQESSILLLDVRPGDAVSIDGEKIKVELVEKSGKLARLKFTAPRDVAVKLVKSED